MDKGAYSIIGVFKCNGNKMLIVRMSGAVCVMTEKDYNRIIITEKKYKQWKDREVA